MATGGAAAAEATTIPAASAVAAWLQHGRAVTAAAAVTRGVYHVSSPAKS